MSPFNASWWSTKRLVTVVGPVVAGVFAVLGVVWAASADRAGVERTLRANEKRIEDHEERIRAVERDMPQVATDVKWIRKAIEKQNGK